MKAVLVVYHIEMWKLGGMSNAVLHNEVAPGQLEISRIFALSCVSCRPKSSLPGRLVSMRQQVWSHVVASSMDLEILKLGVERRHWTKPLRAWEDERRAASFCRLVLVLASAIDVHGDTLRAKIQHAGDDHRLGAHEAPLVIITLCFVVAVRDMSQIF